MHSNPRGLEDQVHSRAAPARQGILHLSQEGNGSSSIIAAIVQNVLEACREYAGAWLGENRVRRGLCCFVTSSLCSTCGAGWAVFQIQEEPNSTVSLRNPRPSVSPSCIRKEEVRILLQRLATNSETMGSNM